MLRSLRPLRPVTIAVIALFAACPAGAFAQGAGDDQYADPFGDMPVEQNQAPAADGGNTPPPDNWNGASDTADSAPATPVAAESDATVEDSSAAEVDATAAQELPRTGLPADLLALIGMALLATGGLIHLAVLRFAPDSGYARALGMAPLHAAPRPPGFEPLVSRRRLRRSRR